MKNEHERLTSLHQNIEILEWKWERIIMDFMIGLLQTLKGLWYNIGDNWPLEQQTRHIAYGVGDLHSTTLVMYKAQVYNVVIDDLRP